MSQRGDRHDRAMSHKTPNAPSTRHTTKIALRRAPTQSSEALDLRARLTAMIKRRHDPETKFLDLSALGKDPEIANTGMFETQSRGAKFFPALMSVCDSIFPSSFKRREAVMSVSLASNTLTSVANVTTLAQTFPNIKNLDLSNNNLSELKSIEHWRREFKTLDHLILKGNPIEHVPDFHLELVKWYPKLRIIDGVQVRSDEEATQLSKKQKSLLIQSPSFRDQDGVAETFIKQFFPVFDSDRVALVEHYYGATSSFSVSINTKSRGVSKDVLAPWDKWIKKSRNLSKITTLGARKSRMFKGIEEIKKIWLELPTSRHPDLINENEKWCIECHGVPGLPDPSGQSPTGVGGLIVVLHGEFAEVNGMTGDINCRRSFDRTFILGPGNTPSGIQVLNDILAIRAYSGYEAFKPTVTPHQSPQVASAELVPPAAPTTSTQTVQIPPGLGAPQGWGLPAADKNTERVQKELIALELSITTRMTLEYSIMCLEQSSWNLQQAGASFETSKANIPAEAFW